MLITKSPQKLLAEAWIIGILTWKTKGQPKALKGCHTQSNEDNVKTLAWLEDVVL